MHDNDRTIAEFFDVCAARGEMSSFDADDESRLEEWLERWSIRPGDRILEPGCGSGRLTERLAHAVGPGGEVLAIDLSPEMIRNARARRLPTAARFAVGSAERIEVPDGYFDRTICLHVFPHFTRPGRALAEFHRVLRRGGDLWIVHLLSRTAVNDRHRRAGGEIARHRIPERDDMDRLLHEHGFRLVEITDTDRDYGLHAVREG